MATQTVTNVLVTTEWVAGYATDAGVRVVEVDVDTTAYDQGHVPGAAGWNWTTELCDTVIRDIVPRNELEEHGAQGITADKPVIAYCRIGERSSHTCGPARHARRPSSAPSRRRRATWRRRAGSRLAEIAETSCRPSLPRLR